MALRIRTIGQITVECGGKPLSPSATVLFATALVLGVERGRRLQRDWLLNLLWPGTGAVDARHNLRQMLYKLRRLGLAAAVDGDAIRVAPDQVELDYEDASDESDADVMTALTATGGVKALPGYTPAFSEPYTEWLDSLRDRVEGTVRRRLIGAIGRARSLGEWDRVEPLARNLLAVDPLNEEATLAMAETLALQGAKAKAVRLLDAFVGEVGGDGSRIALPAKTLRRRITAAITTTRELEGEARRLLGRREAQQSIRQTVAAAFSGAGQSMLMYGAPGAGRTRMLEEASNAATIRGASIAWLASSPSGDSVDGSALRRLACMLLDLPGAMGTNPEAMNLLQQISNGGVVEGGTGNIESFSEEAVLAASIDVARACAWERPVCMLIDDWNRLDSLSQRLLHRLLGAVKGDRIAAFVTTTDDSSIRSSHTFLKHEITRLSATDAKELARIFLGSPPRNIPQSVVAAISEVSSGLPLAISAACNSLSSTRKINGPLSVADFLRQRISEFGQDERLVLLTAILLGDTLTLSELTGALPTTCQNSESAISSLAREGLLRVRNGGQLHVSDSCAVGLNTIFSSTEIAVRRHFVATHLLSVALSRPAVDSRIHAAAGRLLRDDGQLAAASSCFEKAGTWLGERGLPWSATGMLATAVDLATSDSESIRVRFALLKQATAARDRTSQRAILRESQHLLLASPVLSSDERSEVLVCAVESYALGRDEERQTVTACLALLMESSLSDEQKLRVVVVGIHAADHINDTSAISRLSELAHALGTQSDSTSTLHQHIELVSTISERQLSRAMELGDDLAGRAALQPHALQRATMYRHARIPHWYACNHSRTLQLAEAALQEVRAYPTSFEHVLVNDVTATDYLEMLSVNNAQRHLESAVSCAVEFGHSAAFPSLAEMQMRIAVAEKRDAEVSSELTPFLKRPEQLDRTAFYTNCTRAILAARSSNTFVLESLASHLEDAWRRISASCPLDYPAVAIAVLRHRTGSRRAATQMFSQYLANRPAPFPPSKLTLSLMAEFRLS